MANPTFLDFKKSKYEQNNIGLREAVHDAVIFYCDSDSQLRAIEDENVRYQRFFQTVEKETGIRLIISMDQRKTEDNQTYLRLVENWGKYSKTYNYASQGSRKKALLVFYYFLHHHLGTNSDNQNILDSKFGRFIETRLDETGELLDKRKTEAEGRERNSDNVAIGSLSQESGHDSTPNLIIPIEIKNDDDWLNPCNFTSIPLFGRDAELDMLDGFLKAEDHFLILPVIAPSGAGKTRLISEWLCTRVNQKNWSAGFLRDNNPDLWSDWFPTTDTLIIVDYIYQFEEIVSLITKRASQQGVSKTRLILIDHIFPENIEDVPQDVVLMALAQDGNELDERKHHFYDGGPLWLSKLDTRNAMLLDIIGHIAKRSTNDALVERSIRELKLMGDAAMHPLFAALIGFAVSHSDYLTDEQPSRRQLIKYYFDKNNRLPWLDDTIPFGKWVGMFVAVSTARRLVPFETLTDYLPDEVDRSRTGLQPIFRHCNRIVSSNHRLNLVPFEPDIMGETFFLMFVSEFSTDKQGEFWQKFCSLMENATPENRYYTRAFIGFMSNLVRNLANDRQDDPYVEKFWDSLSIFLDPDHYSLDSEIRICMSEILIQSAWSDDTPTRYIVKFLDSVYMRDVITLCENYPIDGFQTLCILVQFHGSEIITKDEIFSILDQTISLIEEEEIPKIGILGIAIKHNYLFALNYLVKQDYIDTNWQNNAGASALFIAVIFNNANALEVLIWIGGANLNLKDNFGNTALHFAVIFDRMECVTALFEHTDLDANVRGEMLGTPLHYACQNGRVEIGVKLASYLKVDPNLKNEHGFTALFLASVKGHLPIVVQLLFRDDIEVNSAAPNGVTPIWMVCYQGHTDIVVELLGHKNIDPNIATIEGTTPLHIACSEGHAGIVIHLLNHKDIEPEVRNNDGKTALDIARELGFQEIVELIEAYVVSKK